MIRKPSISTLSRILDLDDALLPFLTSAPAIFIAIWTEKRTEKGPKRNRNMVTFGKETLVHFQHENFEFTMFYYQNDIILK